MKKCKFTHLKGTVRGATEEMKRSNPNTRTSAGNKNIQHGEGSTDKRQEYKKKI